MRAVKNESKRPGYTEVFLTFAGFYNSYLTEAFDRAMEYATEQVEDALGADAAESLQDAPNWQAAQTYVANAYAGAFGFWLEKATVAIDPEGKGFADLKFEFSELISPKEYNFETDKIAAYVKTEDLTRFYAWVVRTFGEDWKDYFRSRTSHRSGFISFYTAGDPAAYGPISQWPCCLIQLVLDFIEEEAQIESDYLRSDIWFCNDGRGYETAEEALYETSDEFQRIICDAWGAMVKEG